MYACVYITNRILENVKLLGMLKNVIIAGKEKAISLTK